jgi:hypothetical protein
MTSESTNTANETQVLVTTLANEACISLFEAYGMAVRPTDAGRNDDEEIAMTGVIGFTGPGIWGMCLLKASEPPLHTSNPTDGSLRDWMAEVINQLAGRLKRQLVQRGAPVYITTPIVLRGARIEPSPRKNLKPAVFEAPGGLLHLWVEVETAPDFVLTPETAEETIGEGEALLF